MTRTDNHDVEVETLAHTFAVPLIWQVRETNVAGQLPAHDVHVVGHGGCGLGVLRGHSLGGLWLAVRPLVHVEWAARGGGR